MSASHLGRLRNTLMLILALPATLAFAVHHCMIPLLVFTLAAIHNTKPTLIKTGYVLKLSRSQMVFFFFNDTATTEIYTGLRVGFALTLIGSLLAEMFAS